MPPKSELPANVWNFLTRFVPESQRGMAAVEMMKITGAINAASLRVAVVAAIERTTSKMRYNKWSCYAAGFGVGFLFSTIFFQIVF